MHLHFVLMLALSALAAPAAAQDFRFEWRGSGGYGFRGAVSFADVPAKGLWTQDHVRCFEIDGTRDGAPIGRWALGMVTEETTWQLTFDPEARAFVTAGPDWPISQAWNMDGEGMNCGASGFGFNLGDFAQDICLDNTLIVESQVPPNTPFPARETSGHLFGPDACLGSVVVSRQQR